VVPLPAQRVPWPGGQWPAGKPDRPYDEHRLESALRRVEHPTDGDGINLALLVVQGGQLVGERYGPDTDATTPLISWSMAKSITHALLGILVMQGRLDIDAPAPVTEWANDDRRSITIRQLLEMRSGLRFVEDYVDAGVSHCLEMLFGAGKDDVAAFAASLPLDHEPGSVWNYSSGTTNIVARIVGDLVGGGEATMRQFMNDELFTPLGMASADPRFDSAGTFIGSSFLYATARDFARFGLLYLRGGVWDGRRLLPDGWVDDARRLTARDPDGLFDYGTHWWVWRGEPDVFAAHGYEGQFIACVPSLDLVIVRLGKTPAEQRAANEQHLRDVISAFTGT
jgi:CubicO group peptidase (beta-lactamase class C family)